jgi:signal transduction histidine kinase
VELIVRDDGRGFETMHADARRWVNLGLTGMVERVRLAGGDLAIESTPGEGTEVRLSMPAAEA